MEATKVNWIEISKLTVEIVENYKDILVKSTEGEIYFLWKSWGLTLVLNAHSRFTHFAILE